MDHSFELVPGSRAARKKRCSCSLDGKPLNPGCPVHGMSVFRRLRQDPEARSVVDRFFADLQPEQAD
jgi:hypothetical protein